MLELLAGLAKQEYGESLVGLLSEKAAESLAGLLKPREVHHLPGKNSDSRLSTCGYMLGNVSSCVVLFSHDIRHLNLAIDNLLFGLFNSLFHFGRNQVFVVLVEG